MNQNSRYCILLYSKSCGKIVGQDATEIERICQEKQNQDKKVVLNFEDVSFVDHHGASAIRKLVQSNIEICCCSRYVLNIIGKI